MTLKEKIDNAKKSNISKLIFEGNVVGLRVKTFNLSTDCFEYYDFTLDLVSSHIGVKNFINKLHSSMESIELVEYNGIYASKDEILGVITVQEFKDFDSAIEVLALVKKIYSYS